MVTVVEGKAVATTMYRSEPSYRVKLYPSKPRPHDDRMEGWYCDVTAPGGKHRTYAMVNTEKEATVMSYKQAQKVKEMYDTYYGTAMLVQIP